MLKEYTKYGITFSLDSECAEKLDLFVERHDKKWDNVLAITGMEGGGKTKGLSWPMMWYLVGNNFKIVFTPKEFNDAYDACDPNVPTGIIWDEFVMGGMSTDWYEEVQKTLITKLVTGRKKLVYIFLIIPTLYLLRAYFAVHRTISLVHCESSNLIDRDYYFWLGYQTKRFYYFKFKKYQGCSYDTMFKLAQRPGNAICKFPTAKQFPENTPGNISFYPENIFCDELKYEKRKDEIIASIGKEEDKPEKTSERNKRQARCLAKAIMYFKDSEDMTYKEIGEIVDMTSDAVKMFYLRESNKEQKIEE